MTDIVWNEVFYPHTNINFAPWLPQSPTPCFSQWQCSGTGPTTSFMRTVESTNPSCQIVEISAVPNHIVQSNRASLTFSVRYMTQWSTIALSLFLINDLTQTKYPLELTQFMTSAQLNENFDRWNSSFGQWGVQGATSAYFRNVTFPLASVRGQRIGFTLSHVKNEQLPKRHSSVLSGTATRGAPASDYFDVLQILYLDQVDRDEQKPRRQKKILPLELVFNTLQTRHKPAWWNVCSGTCF